MELEIRGIGLRPTPVIGNYAGRGALALNAGCVPVGRGHRKGVAS